MDRERDGERGERERLPADLLTDQYCFNYMYFTAKVCALDALFSVAFSPVQALFFNKLS